MHENVFFYTFWARKNNFCKNTNFEGFFFFNYLDSRHLEWFEFEVPGDLIIWILYTSNDLDLEFQMI